MKEKRPTIKTTILGYKKKSQKSGDYQKTKQEKSHDGWTVKKKRQNYQFPVY